jgi:hypothetical protein
LADADGEDAIVFCRAGVRDCVGHGVLRASGAPGSRIAGAGVWFAHESIIRKKGCVARR